MTKFNQKQMESGRTMLEMLAVLAIVGILTIIGIIGYKMAIQRYKVNESINQIRVSASAIKSGNFKMVKAENIYDEDGVLVRAATAQEKEARDIDPSSYISGVRMEGTGFVTTYGVPVHAQQTKVNEFQLTANLNPGQNQAELNQDDCAFFINPAIGYDFIQVEGGEKCTPEMVMNEAPGCTKNDLCPPDNPVGP